MGTRVLFLLSLGAFAAAVAFLPDDAAQADDGKPSGDGTVVLDVRFVRVITPTPEGVEAPCPFLTGDATTIKATWPEILAALKKRGTTRVLMDTRVTTSDGILAKVSAERQDPITALQSWEAHEPGTRVERHAAARFRTGCKLDVMVAQGRMNVKPEIRGLTDAPAAGGTTQSETLIHWDCTHEELAGETLVLVHRAQVRGPGDEKPTGVEHYVFVHGRQATR